MRRVLPLLATLLLGLALVTGCTSGGTTIFDETPAATVPGGTPSGGAGPSGSGSPSATATGVAVPGFTPAGGVVLGRAGASHHLVIYDDPQCPFCSQVERVNGVMFDELTGAGRISVEYRMVDILGLQSTRADNALACALTDPAGGLAAWDRLRVNVLVNQPEEGANQAQTNFTDDDLVRRGRSVGLTDPTFVDCVNNGTYVESVVRRTTQQAELQDLFMGTPTALLDGQQIPSQYLLDGTRRTVLQQILTGQRPVPAG